MKLKSFALSLSLAAILGGYAAPSFGMDSNKVSKDPTVRACKDAFSSFLVHQKNIWQGNLEADHFKGKGPNDFDTSDLEELATLLKLNCPIDQVAPTKNSSVKPGQIPCKAACKKDIGRQNSKGTPYVYFTVQDSKDYGKNASQYFIFNMYPVEH